MIEAIFLILLGFLNLFCSVLCYFQIAVLKFEPVLFSDKKKFLIVFHTMGVLNLVFSISNFILFFNL